MDLANKYGTLDIQKSLLLLLKEFDSFCQKENIRYSLDSGSLLGAVRHNGFIPWDDDLDIVVDRDNYIELITKIKKSDALEIERMTKSSLWVDRIRCKVSDSNKNYIPTIDVFILDHIPENKFLAFIKKYLIFMLQGMLKNRLGMKKGSVFMKTCAFLTFILGRPFPLELKYKWYNNISQWGNNKSCHYATCYNYMFSEVGTPYHANMLEYLMFKDFEDMQVPITEDYDFTLRQLYGEYMTPPDEEHRKATHIG